MVATKTKNASENTNKTKNHQQLQLTHIEIAMVPILQSKDIDGLNGSRNKTHVSAAYKKHSLILKTGIAFKDRVKD